MGLIIGGILGGTTAAVIGTSIGSGALIGGMLGSAIGGTAVSISSSLYSANQQSKMARAQGEAQQAMANYNSQVAENQAIAAQQTAKMEKKAAGERSDRQKRANKELMARQQAMQMKTGGTFGGSALLVEEDQLAEMKLQELDILHQGELRAREHKLQAMQASASAVGSRFQGTQASQMGNYRAKSLLNQGYMSATAAGAQGISSAASSAMGAYNSWGNKTPVANNSSSYAGGAGGSWGYNPNKKVPGSIYGTA